MCCIVILTGVAINDPNRKHLSCNHATTESVKITFYLPPGSLICPIKVTSKHSIVKN